MKRKFNGMKRLMAWLSKSRKEKKSIYEQLEETIAERNRILPQWEKLFLEKNASKNKDIHVQLKETITEFKKAMKQHNSFFLTNENKKAA